MVRAQKREEEAISGQVEGRDERAKVARRIEATVGSTRRLGNEINRSRKQSEHD